MTESESSDRKPKTIWVWISIAGILFIIIGTLGDKIIFGIIYGIGVSILTASVFKIGIEFVEQFRNKIWLKHHIEIVAVQRKNAARIYISENKKIEGNLKILSFSANAVFSDLENKGSLYKSLIKRNIKFQIIIVNPTSEAAKQRAREDGLGNIKKGMVGITDGFNRLENVFDTLCKLLELDKEHKFDSIEVRVTDDNPYLTLYIRDDNTLIYGHYYSPGRGDENAAMKICRSWNSKAFDQLVDHFKEKWNQAENQRLFLIKLGEGQKLDKKFNIELFKKIYNELKLK